MKTNVILLAILCTIALSRAQNLSWFKLMNNPNAQFEETRKAFEEYKASYPEGEKVPGETQFRRWEFYMERRLAPGHYTERRRAAVPD